VIEKLLLFALIVMDHGKSSVLIVFTVTYIANQQKNIKREKYFISLIQLVKRNDFLRNHQYSMLGILWPVPRKSIVNSLVAALLCVAA